MSIIPSFGPAVLSADFEQNAERLCGRLHLLRVIVRMHHPREQDAIAGDRSGAARRQLRRSHIARFVAVVCDRHTRVKEEKDGNGGAAVRKLIDQRFDDVRAGPSRRPATWTGSSAIRSTAPRPA